MLVVVDPWPVKMNGASSRALEQSEEQFGFISIIQTAFFDGHADQALAASWPLGLILFKALCCAVPVKT